MEVDRTGDLEIEVSDEKCMLVQALVLIANRGFTNGATVLTVHFWPICLLALNGIKTATASRAYASDQRRDLIKILRYRRCRRGFPFYPFKPEEVQLLLFLLPPPLSTSVGSVSTHSLGNSPGCQSASLLKPFDLQMLHEQLVKAMVRHRHHSFRPCHRLVYS